MPEVWFPTQKHGKVVNALMLDMEILAHGGKVHILASGLQGSPDLRLQYLTSWSRSSPDLQITHKETEKETHSDEYLRYRSHTQLLQSESRPTKRLYDASCC